MSRVRDPRWAAGEGKDEAAVAALTARQAAVLEASGAAKPRRRGRAMRRPEQSLQITVVEYLRRALMGSATVWFCPNGGHLSKTQRAVFQRMGLLSGVGDLHIIWRTPTGEPGYGVIEMKAPGKADAASDEQVGFGRRLRACGHRFAVADSLEAVVEALWNWDCPLNTQVRL